MKIFTFVTCGIMLLIPSLFAQDLVQLQWPRQVQTKNATITLYQPQIESWKNSQLLQFRLAVGVKFKNKKKEYYGGIWGSANTYTNMESRIVTLYNTNVNKVKFAYFDEKNEQALKQIINKSFPDTHNVALDRILANLQRSEQEKEQRASVKIRTDPPRIFITHSHTLLTMIDGEPVIRPIEGTGLMHVVNSQWDIILDTKNVQLIYSIKTIALLLQIFMVSGQQQLFYPVVV